MIGEVLGCVDLATGPDPEAPSKSIAIRDRGPWAIAGPSLGANLIDHYHNGSLYDFQGSLEDRLSCCQILRRSASVRVSAPCVNSCFPCVQAQPWPCS